MVIVFQICVREAPSAGWNRDKKGVVVVVVLVFVVSNEMNHLRTLAMMH
jgi:hypothetical protein